MTLETETVLDRRRLRRQVSFWRLLAVVVLAFLVGALTFGGERFAEIAGRPQIARVAIEGTITEDRDQLKLLKRLAEASHVQAVIISVNSPGGTTTGGEALFSALRELAKTKPVVAQFGTVAASAGYIVGLGTDYIVARGNTITGSVGVIVQWPEVSELLDKLGVKVNEVKSGPLKAEPSPFKPLDEKGRQVTQQMIADGYSWFLSLVESRRGIRAADVPGLEDGRIYSGRQALALKLIDEIGGEPEAVRWLEEKRNIPRNLKVVDWKPIPESGWGFGYGTGSLVAHLFGTAAGDLVQMLGQSRSFRSLGLDGLVSVWHPGEK